MGVKGIGGLGSCALPSPSRPFSIPNAFGAEAARVQKASLYLRMFSHIGDQ